MSDAYDAPPAHQPDDPPAHQPAPPPDDQHAPDIPWQRLDARMLVIGPIQALKELIVPMIAAIIGASTSGVMGPWLALPIVALAALMGVVPWLTTRFRVTADNLEVHSGLLSKKRITAPLSRIRSVDLERSLLHRLIGLTKVKVGTGVDETSIDLNALAIEQAAALREELLLARSRAQGHPDQGIDPAWAPPSGPGAGVPDGQPPGADQPPLIRTPAPTQLAELDWSWVRFAPFSLSRMVVVLTAIGATSQFWDNLPIWSTDAAQSAWDTLTSWAVPVIIGVVSTTSLVIWLVISVVGYVVQWAGYRLTRSPETLHLTAGLITTRSVTIEERRIRGIQLDEPALLRLVGGAELSTLATGVSGGVTQVVPPAPAPVVTDLAVDVLPGRDPLILPLQAHGPRARRRCHVRHQWLPLFATIGLAAAVWQDWVPWWAAVAGAVTLGLLGVLFAESEYRHLGHAATEDHLVVGSGVTTRRRTVLEIDGIIGWVFVQTFWQRRRDLGTLIATTAAGKEQVQIVDIPADTAVAFAARVTPALITPFLRPS